MSIRHHFIATACITLALLGCADSPNPLFDPDKNDFIDREAKLSRDDYRNLAPGKSRSEVKGLVDGSEPPIPRVSQILVSPRPPEKPEEQKVSISVTEDVALKDVFIELARLADVDLELDANIPARGIIFRAKNKPLNEVLERIAGEAGLRYSFEGRILRIERDKPYFHSYGIDFLNMTRSSTGDVNISTNVLSAGEGGGDSINTGSTASITVENTSDLWEKFEEAIGKILETDNNQFDDAGGAVATVELGEDGEPIETAAAEAASPMEQASFSVLNKEGGALIVYGTQYQHKHVNQFLSHLTARASAQVLIEAKIVEVNLDEEFRSGIDWGAFQIDSSLDLDFSVVGSNPTGSAFTLNLTNSDGNALEAAVSLTEVFGTSRTLSSPRIHAINNQQAILTFAENEVYFEIDVQRETDSNSATNQELLTVDSTVKTVPIGIIVVVQPSINSEKEEITLNVRPTLSRVTSRVEDPAVAFLAAQAGTSGLNLSNEIPVVEVRELDTIMKLKSGQIMVMGGLMEERSINTDAGVPWVSEIPFVGNLFKDVTKQSNVIEMVIFIKATIVSNTGLITPKDIEVYEKFTADPRPLAF